jgi:hypothetical protein
MSRPHLVRRRPLAAPLLSLLAAASTACGRGTRPNGSMTDEQRIQGVIGAVSAPVAAVNTWTPLFDGRSLAGWHVFKAPGQPPEGWSVVDGTLVRSGRGGDLVTDALYENFELELEWQIGPGGNSGIFYRIDPAAEVTYFSAPEMQVLDDARHRDGQSELTSAGAVYGLYPAPRGIVKPAGEWNAARLVVNGAHVEHWLNGTRIASYELWSPDWEARVKASKFAAWAGYGRTRRGHIGLQDHGDRVAFRNIRIKVLP